MSQYNLNPRRLLLIAAVAVQLLATPALASCISPYWCLCPPTSSGIVVQAKVLDVQAVPAVVLIEGIDNPTAEPTSLAEGVTASADLSGIYTVANYAVGDRFLGTLGQAGGVRAVVRIDKDEHVTCIYATSFRPTVAQARAIMASSNCPQAMTNSGFKAPPCNDTVVEQQGCAVGRGGGLTGLWLALVGAGCLWWRRRPTLARRG